MRLRRFTCVLLLAMAVGFAPLSAPAAFHLWYIQEVFSNHDGSVQFIELYTTFNDQEFLAGQTLTSNAKSFPFTNSPAPTGGHHLLLATEDFELIPGGAIPNYIIPANFFSPAGDTLTFATFYDEKTFTGAPTNGVASLNYTGPFSAATITTNSPRNYNGNGMTVNLPAPPETTGDYNLNGEVDAADYVLWRNTLNTSVTMGEGADGNGNGTIDAGDYEFWRAQFGKIIPGLAGGQAITDVPESTVFVSLLVGGTLLAAFRRAKRPSRA